MKSKTLVIVAILLTTLATCKSLQNKGGADWASVLFSLEGVSRDQPWYSSSGSGFKTALIIAVPGDADVPGLTDYLSDPYDSQLQDLANQTVKLRIPLNTSIRLIKLVFKSELTLNQILTNRPTADSIGMSDAFSVIASETAITVAILMKPIVLSVSPIDGSDDIEVDSNILITFSKAMDGSTVTVNTSGTTCTGTVQISSDSFNNCIQMATSPTADADNKVFTVTPASSLPGLSTYQIKVTTDAKDTKGSAMPARFLTSTGFTTRPGALTGTWTFIDGNGTNGINKNTAQNANGCKLTVFNSRLYATWRESNGTKDQTRVAEWDGSTTWNFVDGNGANGINRDSGQNSFYSELSVFKSKLYATWVEPNTSTKNQTRITEWDGSSAWNFVDGNGTDGINKDSGQHSGFPQLVEFNSRLYAAWHESNGSKFQMRVAEWDGTSTWTFVDGNGSNGINKDTGESAQVPMFAVFNSKLYLVWQEYFSAKRQVRVVEWDGSSTWNFVDGSGSSGINKNSSQEAIRSHLKVYNSKLYATWEESNGTNDQIRVAEWDGASSWLFVDGDGVNGINKNTGQDAERPRLVVFNHKLYAAWNESNGTSFQIRVAEWDGTSTWTFVDGNGTNGINKNTGQDAERPRMAVLNSRLYLSWHEFNGTTDQIRVTTAVTE